MQKEPTIAELVLMISNLEGRIEALEERARRSKAGVVLTGAKRNDQMFYERKQAELQVLRKTQGGDK